MRRRLEPSTLRGRRGQGVLVALLLLVMPGCHQRLPDVILVVVDTLRADRVGACGGRVGLTPFIDHLAASGVAFTNAYSTSSWTNPAVASLFTSRYPSQHQVTRYDSRLGEEEVTLAERLRDAGYRNLGMVANFRLQKQLGFGQGFDVWAPHLGDPKVPAKRIAQDTVTYYDTFFAPYRHTRWMRRERPVFLYLHFLEPHAPYDPPQYLRRRFSGDVPPEVSDSEANAKVLDFARWGTLTEADVSRLAGLYDAEVASLDRRLARLFVALDERGLLRHAIIVVTADHGEEFREHGNFQHGVTLNQESVRVPLVVVGPGLPAGRVVGDAVSIVDIAPTLLDLAGLPAESRFEGRSLSSWLGTTEPADVLLELLPPDETGAPRRHAAGLIRDGLKVLVRPEEHAPVEAFDLRSDPDETRPNPPGVASGAAALRTRMAQWRQSLISRAGAPQNVPIDAETRRRLRSLGYLN